MADSSTTKENLDSLQSELAIAVDVTEAASITMNFLVGQNLTLPSLYLKRGERLRCIGARGYWQIYDGMPPGAGVIGTTYETGTPAAIFKVDDSPNYIPASHKVVAEICVPIHCDERVVGALNVESTTPLADPDVVLVDAVATAFAARMQELGGPPKESPAQRVARHGSHVGSLIDRREIQQYALEAALEVSGMSSAAIALRQSAGKVAISESKGVLATAFNNLGYDALGAMSAWVGKATSCYTFGDTLGLGFTATRSLRESGIAALAVLALEAQGERFGILIVANEEELQPASETMELLELLATQTASSFKTALATEALYASERRFRVLAEHSSDVVCLHEQDGRLLYVSPSCRSVLGYEPAGLLGLNPLEFCHPDDRERVRGEFRQHLEQGGVAIYRSRVASGHYRWLETTVTPVVDLNGVIKQVQSSTRDVTERRQAEESLARQALLDPLTGLGNRILLTERLEAAVATEGGPADAVALLFVDLDEFKSVNDTLGHAAGDELLISIGRRIRHVARPEDVVVRYGGDEFVILCTGVANPAAARSIGHRIVAAFTEPFALEAGRMRITASVGVALSDGAFTSAEDLLAQADAAMYRAKASTTDRCVLFSSGAHPEKDSGVGATA